MEIFAAVLVTAFISAFFSSRVQAAPCTYVAVAADSGEIVELATGHGPRGCIRAKRRCERRANVQCVPDGHLTTKNCSANAQTALEDAFAFLRSHRDELMNDFEVGSRSATKRRIKRRFDRKINRTRIGCTENILCRENAPRIALHAFGIAGNKLRICYDKMITRSFRFCQLVEIVAHEMGHSIGIKKDRLGAHSRNQNDRVYEFGWFARDLCIAERTGSTNYTLTP